MKIQIHNRWLALVTVLLAWLIPIWLTAFAFYEIPDGHLFFASLISSVVTLIIFAIYSPTSSSDLRRKRLEKLLRQLEDEALDLLRERLNVSDGVSSTDGEYDSQETLLNHQKRENG